MSKYFEQKTQQYGYFPEDQVKIIALNVIKNCQMNYYFAIKGRKPISNYY